MPTGTVPAYRHRQAFEFAALGVAWGLSLFGVLRVPWVQAHALLPLTRFQAAVAATLFGTPAASLEVTLACSAADAFALSAGAILGYPAAWLARLAGVGGAILLILSFNTVRIGLLGRAAYSPRLFDALHLYVWPTVITLAIAAYVFGWMRVADRERFRGEVRASSANTPLTGRFVIFAIAFVALFTVLAPFYLDSAGVLRVAVWIARAAATTLNLFGIDATATGTCSRLHAARSS